jgi:hypothetical protein
MLLLLASWPASSKLCTDLAKISTKETYIMTPAEKPSDAARVLRFATRTRDGINTTEAPIPVATPATNTRPNAIPTFSLCLVMMVVVDQRRDESDRGVFFVAAKALRCKKHLFCVPDFYS